MFENLLRATIAFAVLLIVAASAAAQSWGESQGNAILRVGAAATSEPYARPGLFLLGHSARMLPPGLASVYPYGTVRTAGTPSYLVRVYAPAGEKNAVIAMATQRRARSARLTRASGLASYRGTRARRVIG